MILSVVVPVYNVEEYIEECVRSLLDTDDKSNYEILLVDDGSTDRSGKECERLSSLSDNIKVYHKPNGGLSDARNYGLRKATGDFVYFVDSDDFLAIGAIKRIIDMTTSIIDVGVFDADIVNKSGSVITAVKYTYSHEGLQDQEHYSPKGFIKAQLKDRGDFVTTVWLGIYRREFLLTNHLWFEKGLLHEDELWSILVLIKSTDIVYFKEKLYKYRKRENSITSQKKKDFSKEIADLIYIYERLLVTCDHDISDIDFKNELKSNVVKRYLHAVAKFGMNQYRLQRRRISKYRVLCNAKGMKDKMRATILAISISLYCGLSKWLMKR